MVLGKDTKRPSWNYKMGISIITITKIIINLSRRECTDWKHFSLITKLENLSICYFSFLKESSQDFWLQWYTFSFIVSEPSSSMTIGSFWAWLLKIIVVFSPTCKLSLLGSSILCCSSSLVSIKKRMLFGNRRSLTYQFSIPVLLFFHVNFLLFFLSSL